MHNWWLLIKNVDDLFGTQNFKNIDIDNVSPNVDDLIGTPKIYNVAYWIGYEKFNNQPTLATMDVRGWVP
jgi:hypothetical protein